jgi:glyoxylase-like metal-dependent hydrolase (beta-lactamase superfamily II)
MNELDGITRILGRLSNNIYLVESGDELVVFDPGMPSDLRRLLDRVKSLGHSPGDVTAIVLTHFHVDHAGCAGALKLLSGAKVYANAEDVPYLQGEKYIPSVFKAGVQGRALMLLPKTVERYSRVPTVEVDVPFRGGDVLPVLGGLGVYDTPGHTPGSSCFLWREKGVLFTGDAIQNLYLLLTLPEGGFTWDLELAGRSAATVVDALAAEDYRAICAGHGPIVRGSAREKMARFQERLHKWGKI